LGADNDAGFNIGHYSLLLKTARASACRLR
jgi:hypothetical protein